MRHLNKVGRCALGISILSAGVLASSTARANGFETPSNGTEQMARGSAWLARASDPLATFYNPAALSRNGTAASVSVNLFFVKNCFTREDASGQPVFVGSPASGTTSPTYAQNCNDASVFPNPSLAFQYRVTDKLGIGIAVMGPSANGKLSYSNTQTATSVTQNSFTGTTMSNTGPYPSGSRFILTDLDAKIIWPQIAVGYEVAPGLRFGASFIWGIALLKFGNDSMGLNGDGQYTDPATHRLYEKGINELSAAVSGHDYFVPGFVASALYEATENLDVAAWYHWSDSVKAKGQGDIRGALFNGTNPSMPDNAATTTHTPDGQATITVPQPMEARVGARYHRPRDGGGSTSPEGYKIVDPMHDDVFDVELDAEWSHDKQFDTFGLTFPAGIKVPVDGADLGATVPANADVPHKWKDSYGLRLGGDYVAIPDRLALRAGSWFQTSAVDPAYMHLDFIPAQRLGLTGGGTVRLGSFDLQVGFQHVFAKTIDNGGNGSIYALSGQANTTAMNSAPGCGASAPNRSECPVNGGKITTNTNVLSFGVVYRFR